MYKRLLNNTSSRGYNNKLLIVLLCEVQTLFSAVFFRLFFLLNLLLFTSHIVSGASRTSSQSGPWSSASTWVGGVVPTAADDVTIAWGHTITPGLSTDIVVLNLTNNGTLNVAGNLTVTGTLTTAWATTIQVAGNFSSTNSFTNNGTLQISGNLTLSAGSLTNGDAKLLTVGGYMDVSGSVENSGTSNITENCTIGGSLTNNDADQFTVGGVLTVDGNVSNRGNLQITENCVLGGTLTNNDNDTFTVGGFLSVVGDVSNRGTFQVIGNCDFGGSLTNNDNDIFSTGGNLTVNNGITNSGNFSVTGISQITGDVTNNDSDFLYLGIDVTIVGNVTNSGTFVSGGDLDITGAITNNHLDLIVVNGTFTKDGNLSSQGYIVVGGNYVSEGGTTTINDWNGDFYVIGENTCSDSECGDILDVYTWLTTTPGLPYLSSVTAEFDDSGTFTVPSGISTLVVECWGGGGGGGNASHSGYHTSRGGGGAGGSYSAKTITPASGTYNFTVGAGGTGGNNGNASWFGTTSTVFAQGGAAGNSGDKTNATGGLGSIANSIGDLKRPGGNGGDASASGTGGGGGGAGSNGNGKDALGNIAGGSMSDYGGAGGAGITSGAYVNGNIGSLHGGGGSGSVSIGNPGTATTGGSGAKGKVRVTFSTLPFVKFDAATTSQTEANTTLTINISMTTASSSNVTLPFSISSASTATGGGIDYTLNTLTNPLTIAAGNTTASISVAIHQDETYETDETIIIQLGIPTNAALGTPSSHTITIVNDDAPPVNGLTVSPVSVCLGSSLTFTASNNCAYIDSFYSSPDNLTWTKISNPFTGTCTANYTPPSSGTYYYRYHWRRNPGQNGYSTSSEAVTVNPLPQGSLTANGPFCSPATGQLTWTATTGTGPYTVVYSDGTANHTVYNVNSGTAFNVFTSPVTATTTYTLVSVTDANGCTRATGFTGATAVISINSISVSISTTYIESCPELIGDQGFEPNNTGYDAGATKVTFTVTLNGSTTTNWEFDYVVEDATVRLGSEPGGHASPNPQSDNGVTVTESITKNLHFYINNVPGTTLHPTLKVTSVTDEFSCTDATVRTFPVTIKAMPVVGSFN